MEEEEGEAQDIIPLQTELLVPPQPPSGFETLSFVRSLPQSRLPNSSLACTSPAFGSSLEPELSLGLALCFAERLRGHSCFSMVTIGIMLHRGVWSLQRFSYNEFRLFISRCLLKQTLGREGAPLPRLRCRCSGR